jgi:rSAM/selenodomain-associated transferase 1
MSGRPTVLVFLRDPQPGRVKTRLAAALGPDRTVELYRDWIGLTFRALQPVRGPARLVGYFDGPGPEPFADWHDLADDWWPQPPGGLGERLEAGFARAGGPVVAVGTDCPELDADLVRQAFAELRSRDAVFGPTPDGGYYLVGAARPAPGFFAGIRWSSPHTRADHLARCQAQGWTFTLLPDRHDIDTEADWLAYRERTAHAGRRCPDAQ